MRIHLAGAAVAVGLGLYCGLERWEWLWIAFSIALVFSAECINTAIERTVDLASEGKRYPLGKAAKDTAAAAVLVVSLFSLIVAALVLVPALLEKFGV